MKKTILSMSIAALLAVGSSAHAASHGSAPEVELSANVAMTTNYIFRGFSQTDNSAAVSGGFDLAYGGFYTGIWGSNVDETFLNGANLELDLYLGYGGEIGSFSYDVGALYFYYPDQNTPANANIDTLEWHVGLGTDVGPASLGYTWYYSEDFFNLDDGSRHEFSVDFAVNDDVSIGAYWATQEYTATDYEDYGLSVGTSLGGFDFSLAYSDTSGPQGTGVLAEEQVSFTVGKSF